LAPPLPGSGGNTDNYIEHFEGHDNFSPLGKNSSWDIPALEITILSGLHYSTYSEESLILMISPISLEYKLIFLTDPR